MTRYYYVSTISIATVAMNTVPAINLDMFQSGLPLSAIPDTSVLSNISIHHSCVIIIAVITNVVTTPIT